MGTNVIQVSYNCFLIFTFYGRQEKNKSFSNCFLIFTFYGRQEKNKSFSSSEEDNELVFAFRSADVNDLS